MTASPEPASEAAPTDLVARVQSLVEEVRATCLWFLDPDFLPRDRDQSIRALRHIERHADRETYIRARQLRKWLSQTSSEPSAAPSPTSGEDAARAT